MTPGCRRMSCCTPQKQPPARTARSVLLLPASFVMVIPSHAHRNPVGAPVQDAGGPNVVPQHEPDHRARSAHGVEKMTTRETIERYFDFVKARGDWPSLFSATATFTSFASPVRQIPGRDAFVKATAGFYGMIREVRVRDLLVDGERACALTHYRLEPPNVTASRARARPRWSTSATHPSRRRVACGQRASARRTWRAGCCPTAPSSP